MKKTILSSFLLIQTLFGTTSDFSLVIEKPFTNALIDVTQDYDRDISALGITRNFSASGEEQKSFTDPFEYLQSLSVKYGATFHRLKIDGEGNIKEDKSLPLAKFATPSAFVKTPTNGYFIGGSTQSGSFIFLKLSAEGNLEWQKEVSNPNKDTMHSLLALQDGSVLAIGTTFTSKNNYDIFDGGVGLNDIVLVKISANAEILWGKKIGTQDDDFGIDAIELNDGSIVVLGKSIQNDTHSLILAKLSQNGEKIRFDTIPSQTHLEANKIIKLKENNFLVALTQQDSFTKEQIRLIKLDSQHKVLADKTITTTYPSSLRDIAESHNSDLFGVGWVRDEQNTDALAMKFDRNLNLICQDHFGDESYDRFDALSILHNSQIAAVGAHTPSYSQETNMWLVKLNDDCSIAQKNTHTPLLHKQLSTILATEIDAKEVTLSKDFLLEIHESALYFDVGAYTLTKEHKVFLERFSKKLIPFLLQYADAIEAVEINGHTSSEWGKVDFAQGYLNNAKLSMNRSYSVLHFIFSTQEKKTQQLLTKLLKGSGWSYAKKQMLDSMEDKERSRRVTFKILFK